MAFSLTEETLIGGGVCNFDITVCRAGVKRLNNFLGKKDKFIFP